MGVDYIREIFGVYAAHGELAYKGYIGILSTSGGL